MELLNWFFECVKAEIVDSGVERGEADITRLFTQSYAIAPDYNMMFARMAWSIFESHIHHGSGVLFMYDI